MYLIIYFQKHPAKINHSETEHDEISLNTDWMAGLRTMPKLYTTTTSVTDYTDVT